MTKNRDDETLARKCTVCGEDPAQSPEGRRGPLTAPPPPPPRGAAGAWVPCPSPSWSKCFDSPLPPGGASAGVGPSKPRSTSCWNLPWLPQGQDAGTLPAPHSAARRCLASVSPFTLLPLIPFSLHQTTSSEDTPCPGTAALTCLLCPDPNALSSLTCGGWREEQASAQEHHPRPSVSARVFLAGPGRGGLHAGEERPRRRGAL